MTVSSFFFRSDRKRAWPIATLVIGIVIGIAAQKAGLAAKARSLFVPASWKRPRLSLPDPADKCFMLLALGQSNAGNYSDALGNGGPGTYAFWDGKFFGCDDPLPGAGGEGGSVWVRVASRVLFEGDHQASIVCTAAQGSTSVRDWLPDGALFQRALNSAKKLQQLGFPISAVVWHQGETDALLQTPARLYQERLERVVQGLREQGIDAPVFVCVASRRENGRTYEPVRLAQQAVVDIDRGIHQGCDTDLLDLPYRRDGIHFNLRGVEAFAEDIVGRFVEVGLVRKSESPQEPSKR